MDELSQQLAVAKAIDYTDVTEVAFVLELHAQVASTNPALMLTVVENICGRGDMKLAFKLLQENIQLAEQNRHVYSMLLGRLRPWHGEPPKSLLRLCLLTVVVCLSVHAHKVSTCCQMQHSWPALTSSEWLLGLLM